MLTVESSNPAEIPHALRCCVYQRSAGVFVAECIDLDLMVEAKTASRAQRELRDAIMGYIETVFSMGQQATLIPRLSPVSHRLHFHALKALSKIFTPKTSKIYSCNPEQFRSGCYA